MVGMAAERSGVARGYALIWLGAGGWRLDYWICGGRSGGTRGYSMMGMGAVAVGAETVGGCAAFTSSHMRMWWVSGK